MSITHGVPDEACVMGCQTNVIRAFLALPLAVLFSAMVRRVSSPLHLTLYTLHSALYTLRPTQAFPPSVMCTAVARRVSRVSVSIRAHPWAVYLRYLLCFASGLAMFTPLSFRSRGCLVLGDGSPSILAFTPYTLHPTPKKSPKMHFSLTS